jgi:outer membrane lipoprotein-sorting protein
MSGSVSVSTDLGLPSALTGGLAGAVGQATGGHAGSADPRTKLPELLSGTHTLRVAVDGPDRARLTIADGAASYTLVHDGGQAWAYDGASHTAFRATVPTADGHGAPTEDAGSLTPQQIAAHVLAAAGPTTRITVDGTAEVAGRDAYELLLTPKESGSTVGGIRIAVDAEKGVPLAVTLTPSGGGAPVVDVAYTRISFAAPAASEFRFTVPKGTHVTTAPRGTDGAAGSARKGAPSTAPEGGLLPGLPGLDPAAGHRVVGKGWTAVAELGAPSGHAKGGKSDADGALGSFGTSVKGAFGSGEVFSTRLVNVLVTQDGAVYAGAVTPAELVKAADANAK